MSLLSESFLCRIVKLAGAVFSCLPRSISLSIASAIGLLGYYSLPKKRVVVQSNLKIAFSKNLSYSEITVLSKKIFQNFTCSFMDLLCLARIKDQGFEKTVTLEGKENITQALTLGKGCIFLAIHSGSWELASLVGSMCDHPYNIVANEQQKTPQLNELLNDYRRMAGAKVIPPGSATREIIRALQSNEIVSLVLDQGGKNGLPLEFLGKTASMSTGAIRLGIKYQTPVCPVWIERQPGGRHVLRVLPALQMQISGEMEKDVFVNTQKAVKIFEDLLRTNPSEYMWFYKVYKYTTQADILILDDTKTGHLRQSQAACESLKFVLSQVGKSARVKFVTIDFKNNNLRKIFVLYCALSQIFSFLRKERILKFCLSERSCKELTSIKPDYIISCGSQSAGLSFILSRLGLVKTIHILRPGILSMGWFSLIVLPEHDKQYVNPRSKTVLTKVALNMITPEYLKDQEGKLLLRYSHLKGNVRSKMGVLIGGNTRGVVFDVQQMRLLVRQLKEAAKYFNMDLLVTTSRRTPKAADEVIIKELRNFERCALLVIANESNIPEAVGGILALSDILVVSGESISMVSEAITSGKKTIVFAPQGSYATQAVNKYDRFVQELSSQGYVLASSIKDINGAITQVMSHKISVKMVDDKKVLLEAIRGLVS